MPELDPQNPNDDLKLELETSNIQSNFHSELIENILDGRREASADRINIYSNLNIKQSKLNAVIYEKIRDTKTIESEIEILNQCLSFLSSIEAGEHE